MRVQRTCTKQLRAPLTTTLRHPKSTRCNFNSCSFNCWLDYNNPHLIEQDYSMHMGQQHTHLSSSFLSSNQYQGFYFEMGLRDVNLFLGICERRLCDDLSRSCSATAANTNSKLFCIALQMMFPVFSDFDPRRASLWGIENAFALLAHSLLAYYIMVMHPY